MEDPAKSICLRLIIGFFLIFTSAAGFTCPPPILNETQLCASISLLTNVTDPCTPQFQQYACSDPLFLAGLPDNVLVKLSSCYSNNTILSLDPIYATLLFSKLNSSKTSAVFDQLSNQFSSLHPKWKKFLLDGIWAQLIENLGSPAAPTQWTLTNVQPFLLLITPDIVMCLQQQSVSCEVFQELVRNLNVVFSNMTAEARKILYPSLISFLNNQKNMTGSACSQNMNSSMWIKQNLGQFSQFDGIMSLTSLGRLVTRLPSNRLHAFPQADLISAAKNPQFVRQLSIAPYCLQSQFVQLIIAGDSNTSNLVNNVPANLVSFIPLAKLLSNSGKLSLNDVNGKSWTTHQAAMFFDDLLPTTVDYTDFSASIMKGFTCVTPNKIDNDQLKNLAKAMKTQNAALTEDQLTCLSRQVVKNGYPSDLDLYPKEIFLYLNATTYSMSANSTCKDFFTRVGAADVSVLQKGASLRRTLLSRALSCMNVSGFSLTSDHAQVLGHMICDLNSTYIDRSYPDLAATMARCPALTRDQLTAILNALSKGSSSYGPPSSWTKDTLNSLGATCGLLTKDILMNISTSTLNSWLAGAIPNNLLPRTHFAAIIKILHASTRAKRATGCTQGNITADNVYDDLLPIEYNAIQLDACLDNDTLINYLDVLTNKPFTEEHLAVLKNRLDMIYPSGYPESILPSLGAIVFQCTDSDVGKWNITSVDTLQGLLASGPTDNVVTSVIGKYINLGNPLNSNAINTIGSYICLLTSGQLNLINSTDLGEAQPLNISSCNQTAKDTLYSKAKAYSQGVTNDTSAYFKLMKSYLGGAPLEDLKTLASQSPNMDVGTFVTLNPSVVADLTVSDVKSLLGNNTADLTIELTNPTVSQWISRQRQSDLDTLGLGIQGGIRDTATTAPANTVAVITITSPSSAPASKQGLSFILVLASVIFLL